MKAKKITLCGLLTALAVVLSLVERLFPLDAVVPVPGVKLGLANVVTLFALTRVSARDALAVVVCRVAISSLLMGSVTAFLFSLFGGLLSLIVMWALLRAEGTFCSLLGVSVAGAAAHNIGQVIAAVIWMKGLYPVFSCWIEKIPMRAGKILTWIFFVFMVVNMAVSGLALIRSAQRADGIPATSQWQKVMDTHFDDKKLQKIYPNAKDAEDVGVPVNTGGSDDSTKNE